MLCRSRYHSYKTILIAPDNEYIGVIPTEYTERRVPDRVQARGLVFAWVGFFSLKTDL